MVYIVNFVRKKQSYYSDNLTRLKKLYLNYWIIVLLFPVILGLVLGFDGYPGSWQKLLLNLTAIDPSYNGAWWFLTTYIIFVLTSRFWFGLLETLHPIVFLVALLIIYLIAFYFRIYNSAIFENRVFDWVHRQLALYFCTFFQFMLGAFALKFDWNDKVNSFFKQFRFKNTIILLCIAFLIAAHGVVPNFVIAPFTGLAFIFLFLQLDLPELLNRIIDFFTPHSTNIWLVHMFFYMIYFPSFIYSAKYVVPIFALLVLLSVLSSYAIKFIERPLSKLLFSFKS